jgi:DNA-directed RNA polymerase specialized sigma24 family protein
MAIKKTPNRDVDRETVLTYTFANPQYTYKQIAEAFNLSVWTVSSWVKDAKKKDPSITRKLPPKVTNTPSGEPTTLQVLPPDLILTAQKAIRLRLERLAQQDVVDAESSRDMRETIKVVIESFTGLKDINDHIVTDFDPSKEADVESVMDDLNALPDHVKEALLGGK